MKKFLYNSLLFGIFFILYFFLINFLYIEIIINSDIDFKKRLESLKFDNPDFDLIVLGASTSLDGIDNELLTVNGIKSYNLAIGGCTVKTNYIQLKEYLTKYRIKPQYVLLCLNEPLIKSFDEDIIHPIVEVTMKDHRYTIDDIPILKFKWLGFEFFKKIISKNHRKVKLVYGQAKFQKSVSDKTSFKNSSLNLNEFASSYWIGEIAGLCNTYGIKFILMEMPGFKETQNLSEIGPYSIIFKNGSSAELYNFNNRAFCDIFDPKKDWIGNSHLNEYGAKKLSKELMSLLKAQQQ